MSFPLSRARRWWLALFAPTLHEAGSAGTLAGELPVEHLAGKGAGAPGNGSWVQKFNARNVLSKRSLPARPSPPPPRPSLRSTPQVLPPTLHAVSSVVAQP